MLNENLIKAFESAKIGNAEAFRSAIVQEMHARINDVLDARKDTIGFGLLGESPDPTPEKSETPEQPQAQSNSMSVNPELKAEIDSLLGADDSGSLGASIPSKDDISLDPSIEREYLMSTEDYKDHKISIKQFGTGLNRPVRVYINDQRWECFPGPKKGLSMAKEHIDNMVKEARQAQRAKTKENQIEERVLHDGRTKAIRETIRRIEQARLARKSRAEKADSSKESSGSSTSAKVEIVNQSRSSGQTSVGSLSSISSQSSTGN